MQTLSTEQLAEWLAKDSKISEHPILLDVREAWEFELCRLSGSISIPLSKIPSEYAQLNLQSPIVCICHHGVRSRQAALFLEQQGAHNIFNLSGGIDAWAKQIDSTMATY